jgi:type I restriction enzyme, S subunit
MRLPNYPKYLSSGVPALGAVPSHWRVSRLGYESWVRARLGWKGLKADEYVEDGFAFLATPNIKNRDIDFLDVNFISKARYEESPEIMLSEGDVLLAKDGSTLGTVNIVRKLPRPATVNSSIAVITPHAKLNGLFLHYTFQSEFFQSTIQRLKGGMGVPHLFQADLNKFYLPLPPIQEQVGIAAFLDRETAKIDTLIAEQEKLVALLAEKRKATILYAVTRGINPDASFKDSAIPWMGEVPAHWAISSLGRVSSERCDGPFGSGIKSDHYTEEGAFVVRLQNIRAASFNVGEPVYLDRHYFEGELKGHEVIEGDLLVAGLGDDNNLLGRSCVAPSGLGVALVKADCFRFRLDQKRVLPEFLAFQLSAGAVFDAGYLATGTTRARIPLGVMSKRKVAFPDICEQAEIVVSLISSIRALDELRSSAEQGIDLLKERRSALITAAVTGQIDVRRAVEAYAA